MAKKSSKASDKARRAIYKANRQNEVNRARRLRRYIRSKGGSQNEKARTTYEAIDASIRKRAGG